MMTHKENERSSVITYTSHYTCIWWLSPGMSQVSGQEKVVRKRTDMVCGQQP